MEEFDNRQRNFILKFNCVDEKKPFIEYHANLPWEFCHDLKTIKCQFTPLDNSQRVNFISILETLYEKATINRVQKYGTSAQPASYPSSSRETFLKIIKTLYPIQITIKEQPYGLEEVSFYEAGTKGVGFFSGSNFEVWTYLEGRSTNSKPLLITKEKDLLCLKDLLDRGALTVFQEREAREKILAAGDYVHFALKPIQQDGLTKQVEITLTRQASFSAKHVKSLESIGVKLKKTGSGHLAVRGRDMRYYQPLVIEGGEHASLLKQLIGVSEVFIEAGILRREYKEKFLQAAFVSNSVPKLQQIALDVATNMNHSLTPVAIREKFTLFFNGNKDVGITFKASADYSTNSKFENLATELVLIHGIDSVFSMRPEEREFFMWQLIKIPAVQELLRSMTDVEHLLKKSPPEDMEMEKIVVREEQVRAKEKRPLEQNVENKQYSKRACFNG